MSEEELDIELIEKYHRGLLNGSDLETFHQRRQNDETFANSVEAYKDIFQAIEYFGKQKDIGDTIGEWEKEIKDQNKKKQTGQSGGAVLIEGKQAFLNRDRIYWAAAAVITLAIVSYIFLFQAPNPDKLYEA